MFDRIVYIGEQDLDVALTPGVEITTNILSQIIKLLKLRLLKQIIQLKLLQNLQILLFNPLLILHLHK